MTTSKRRFPFYVSILTLFFITMGGLSAALIYVGQSTGTAIRLQAVESQIYAAEHGVETFTKTRLNVIARVQKTLITLPAANQQRLISGESIEELLPALIPTYRAMPSIVSTLIGFENGDFFYFSDTDHLDKNLKGLDEIPTGAKYAALTIKRTGQVGRAHWWFFNEEFMAIGDFDGKILNYDPRHREWYEMAQTEGHSILSKPYVFAATGTVGTTFATPMPNGNGVIGTHFSISQMSQLMEGFKITPSSIAFIVGEDHQIIHHPYLSSAIQTAEGILRPATLSDYEDPIIEAITTHIDQGDIGKVFQINAKGEKYVTYVGELRSAEGFRFFTALATPERELTGDIDEMRDQAAVIVLVVMGSSVIILLIVASYISKPINRLTEMAQKIANLDLSETEPVNTRIQEVAYLSNTMVRMRESLSTFGQYVPRQLVNRIMANPEAANLGGQKREVTAMFSDVQGFTSISETMEPEEMLPLISDYFQVMTDCIMDHHGIVDKFIGDAVMAIWNAPDDDPDHAIHACQTALMAKVKLAEFNEALKAQGKPPLLTRIGINTGVCVAGNVGSDDRKDYTIFGPMVNMAARLEALNKNYDSQILVSEVLYSKVKDKFDFRHIDQVIPKGASQPMDIYELVSAKS